MGPFIRNVLATVVAAIVVGLVFWAANLEGRVAAAERDTANLEDRHTQAVEQFRDDVAYLRSRIDAAIAAGQR